jgi:hypothetical protein
LDIDALEMIMSASTYDIVFASELHINDEEASGLLDGCALGWHIDQIQTLCAREGTQSRIKNTMYNYS